MAWLGKNYSNWIISKCWQWPSLAHIIIAISKVGQDMVSQDTTDVEFFEFWKRIS